MPHRLRQFAPGDNGRQPVRRDSFRGVRAIALGSSRRAAMYRRAGDPGAMRIGSLRRRRGAAAKPALPVHRDAAHRLEARPASDAFAELLGVLGLDNDPPRCARRPLAPATQRCREIDALLLGAETAPVPPRAGWPRAPGGSGSSPRGVPPVPRIRSLHAARVVVARARHREAPYAGRVGSRADERPSDCGAPAAATPSHPSVA
jgi:hypothetical protein